MWPIRELQQQNIKSPTGKERWNKRTIDTLLSNEKYTGDVTVLKTYSETYPDCKRRANKGQKARYQAPDIVPAIITKELFQAVAEEKVRRSNMIETEDGYVRKSAHYSMKRPKSDDADQLVKDDESQ